MLGQEVSVWGSYHASQIFVAQSVHIKHTAAFFQLLFGAYAATPVHKREGTWVRRLAAE